MAIIKDIYVTCHAGERRKGEASVEAPVTIHAWLAPDELRESERRSRRMGLSAALKALAALLAVVAAALGTTRLGTGQWGWGSSSDSPLLVEPTPAPRECEMPE